MILAFTLLMNVGWTQELEPLLSVRSHVIVESDDEINLADVAEIQNASPSFLALAKGFKLCNAPATGERRTFSAHAISELLRSFQGELERHQLRARFVLPHSVIVERTKLEFDVENVREVLLSAWSKLCSHCRLVVSDLRLPAYSGGEMGAWNIQVKEQLPKGSFSVPVRISKPNVKQGDLYWIQGRLDILKQVPVANRAIYFGERLAENDFRWEYRDVTFASDSSPQAPEMVGQRVRSPLRVNDVIWRSSLEREKALVRGAPVRMRLSDDSFSVSMDGKAEQDGYLGDTVSVRNPKSQKVISATVTGKGEVLVQ